MTFTVGFVVGVLILAPVYIWASKKIQQEQEVTQ